MKNFLLKGRELGMVRVLGLGLGLGLELGLGLTII